MLNTTGKKIIAAIAAVFVAFVGWNFFSGEETETETATTASTETTTTEDAEVTPASDAEAVRAADAVILGDEEAEAAPSTDAENSATE
jgi:hypothetical protein